MDLSIRLRDRRTQAAIGGGLVLALVVLWAVVTLTGGPTSKITADEGFVDVSCDGDGARGLVRNDTDDAIEVGVDVAFVNDAGGLLHVGGRTGIDVAAQGTAPWSVDYNPKFAPERLRDDHPNCEISLVPPTPE